MSSVPWTKEWYLQGLENYQKRCGKAFEPKPPYDNEEIPVWWPYWLRQYLTTVSRESVLGSYPVVIGAPHYPTKSLDTVKQEIRQIALADVEMDGGWGEYLKTEIEGYPEMSLEELQKIYFEVEEFDSLSITVGEGGCSFSTQCDLRTGEIYDHCADDMYDLVYYHNRYRKYMSHGSCLLSS